MVGFGGNPFEVIDGDDGEGEVGDLGLAGEVDDGGAAKGADFDKGVVGLEDFDEVVVKGAEVEEAGDGGEGGEEIVEFLAGGVVFVGVLAFVGGIGGGGAEGGVIVAEGEVAAVDDDAVEVGGAGEMVVGKDGEEPGVEEVAGGEVAGAGEDGDAEEGVDAVAVVDGENLRLGGIGEAVEEGDVPMKGRVEVVGDLDEDATGGDGGGEVPGGDGAGVGFFDDDVAKDLEGFGVEVFGVEGEDVFDGVGVFGGVQPFAPSGGGLGGASPGGVEEGDFASVFLEVVEFNGVGVGELAFHAVDLGADLEAKPAVEFALSGPRGVFGEGKGDGGAVEGGGGIDVTGGASHVCQFDEGLTAGGVGAVGEVKEGFGVFGGFGVGGEGDEDFVFFSFSGLGQFDEGGSGDGGFFHAAGSEEFGEEVIAVGGGEGGFGDGFEDAEVALRGGVGFGGHAGGFGEGGVDDFTIFEADFSKGGGGIGGDETFVDGGDPMAFAGADDAFAKEGDVEDGDFVGHSDPVGGFSVFGEDGFDAGDGFGGDEVVGIGPDYPGGGGEGEGVVAGGGEVVDVGPVVGGAVVVGFEDEVGGADVGLHGQGEGFVGLLVADGADEDDFVDEGGEGFEEAGDVAFDVSDDGAKGDFERGVWRGFGLHMLIFWRGFWVCGKGKDAADSGRFGGAFRCLNHWWPGASPPGRDWMLVLWFEAKADGGGDADAGAEEDFEVGEVFAFARVEVAAISHGEAGFVGDLFDGRIGGGVLRREVTRGEDDGVCVAGESDERDGVERDQV